MRNRTLRTCFISLALLAASLACAQDARTNAPRIYRDRVEAQWFADAGGATNKFWYRVSLPDGKREFILVDAEAGTRQPAFDHARVAAALAKATEREVDAGRLPVTSLVFAPDGKSVELRGSGKRWNLELESYALTALEGGPTEERRLPASRFSR